MSESKVMSTPRSFPPSLPSPASGSADVVVSIQQLHSAAMTGDAQLMRVLLAELAQHNPRLIAAVINDTSAGGFTPLISAARNGHSECVSLLIHYGAYVQAATNHGNSALMYASANGHVELVRMLLTRGATPLIRNINDDSVLLWATINGHVNVVKLLLEQADVSQLLILANREGITTLMCAAMNGNETLIDLLTALDIIRASVNAKNKHGNTALHIAAECGHAYAIKRLLEIRADTRVVNERKQRAIHCAKNKATRALLTSADEAATNADAQALANFEALMIEENSPSSKSRSRRGGESHRHKHRQRNGEGQRRLASAIETRHSPHRTDLQSRSMTAAPAITGESAVSDAIGDLNTAHSDLTADRTRLEYDAVSDAGSWRTVSTRHKRRERTLHRSHTAALTHNQTNSSETNVAAVDHSARSVSMSASIASSATAVSPPSPNPSIISTKSALSHPAANSSPLRLPNAEERLTTIETPTDVDANTRITEHESTGADDTTNTITRPPIHIDVAPMKSFCQVALSSLSTPTAMEQPQSGSEYADIRLETFNPRYSASMTMSIDDDQRDSDIRSLQQRLHHRHPRSMSLALLPQHIFGDELESLSVAQLAGVEDILHNTLRAVTDAKDRLQTNTHMTMQHDIVQARKEINELQIAMRRLQEQQQVT